MTIRHVLLDADGVLQHATVDWYEALEPWFDATDARAFMDAAWEAERKPLAGDGDFVDVLDRMLLASGRRAEGERLHEAVWRRLRAEPTSMALVAGLRAQGIGVHLGSNQERNRAEHMNRVFGYPDLFDSICYSYLLGVAKPDPEYFRRCLARIADATGEVDPADVLFIDDRADNVESARSVGLAGICWDLDQGHAVLREAIAEHGLAVQGWPA
ncbi:HAD family hydrolase [Nocardioides bruguierae]|uniref:HAD family hydrolase n=1 Tax=Nocardioides bruguierae TaxID=2945102 RepID=UPI0020218099|nr:HAD-IA family hydrolase [Nocardioides bruguierae]MCL8025127.1 HAD-IA family hydrolase [Nocardioides bruguierae]